MMQLSDAGLAAIKRHEGLRLDAYPDPGSSNGLPATIGYGSTKTLTGKPWQLGDRISEAEAEALLIRDIEDFESAVNRLVTVPLTQAMFDALVSLTFNIGIGAFSGSTLLRELNAGNYAGAQAQFQRWRMNDGKVMQGLVNRRAAEAALFASQGLVPPAQGAASAPIYRPVNDAPAPIVESAPVYVQKEPMTPFIAAALPALVQAIPGLIRSFGNGEVTERNAKAAEAVLQVVQSATGTQNAQAAVEAVTADPAARAAATEALARESWFEPTEPGEGVNAAREFNREIAQAGTAFWRMPAFAVTALLLPLAYMVVGSVLFDEASTGEMKALVIGAVVSGVLASITAFWLGTSMQQARK